MVCEQKQIVAYAGQIADRAERFPLHLEHAVQFVLSYQGNCHHAAEKKLAALPQDQESEQHQNKTAQETQLKFLAAYDIQ